MRPRPRLGIAIVSLLLVLPAHGHDRAVAVASSAQLAAAIDGALAGDVITLAPGTYTVSQNLICDAVGTADHGITVRATTAGTVLIRFDVAPGAVAEGFKVEAPHWTFENLTVAGICADHDDCEHAFHLAGAADWTTLRDLELRDFNAQVKSNGDGLGAFPDDVLLVGNRFFDTASRATANPVTKIDVVGGRRWVVRGNEIRDFHKNGGNFISYGAFLKGNSRDGLFERNLVICEDAIPGDTRIGLSFGGGGTGAQFCEEGSCTTEHQNGTMVGNLVLHCSDVGIYLNRAANTRLLHNTLHDTWGIDVRFDTSFAGVRYNVLSGTNAQIRLRDGGSSFEVGNLEQVPLASMDSWFAAPDAANFALTDGTAIVDQAAVTAGAVTDFCGNAFGAAGAAPDRGAIEYVTAAPCDTTRGGGGRELFVDGFARGGVAAWSGHAP